MIGSLYLLDIDVLVQKYWENASELPEKDWCFMNSVWIANESNMRNYDSSNFQKANCGDFYFTVYQTSANNHVRSVDWFCMKEVWKNLQFLILEMEKHQSNASKGSYSCTNLSGFVRSSRREKQRRQIFSPQLVDNLLSQKSFSFEQKYPSVKCDWLFTFKCSQTPMKQVSLCIQIMWDYY